MPLDRTCVLLAILWTMPAVAAGQGATSADSLPLVWRNFRRDAPAFPPDSAACSARATADARGMSDAARARGYEGCLAENGWNRMRVVAEGTSCAPVVLQPAGIDSASVAPLLSELTSTLTRRFRPPSPDDTPTRLVLTVSSDDLRARTQGIDQAPIPLAARLAVAGAKGEMTQFKTRPGVTPVQFVASFEPKCVTEFLAEDALPVPTQGAYFEFQVSAPARPISGNHPVYPPALRDAHVEGRVLAQFVVDESGVPEMATFKVLLSENVMFSEAVRDAVAMMRFTPASIGGRHVRQVVQQPFTFAIR